MEKVKTRQNSHANSTREKEKHQDSISSSQMTFVKNIHLVDLKNVCVIIPSRFSFIYGAIKVLKESKDHQPFFRTISLLLVQNRHSTLEGNIMIEKSPINKVTKTYIGG